jgi:hypothetical protein
MPEVCTQMPVLFMFVAISDMAWSLTAMKLNVASGESLDISVVLLQFIFAASIAAFSECRLQTASTDIPFAENASPNKVATLPAPIRFMEIDSDILNPL